MKLGLRVVGTLIVFLALQAAAFASISIGGPRGFDFGADGNLYFSQGPTSAFPPGVGFEGIAALSGIGQFSQYAMLSPGAGTAPIMSNDGSFYAGKAGGGGQIQYYSSGGLLQSTFQLTSSVVNPSGLGNIDDLVEGSNGNLYLYVHESSGGLIQEYTTSGTLVAESAFLPWANPAYLAGPAAIKWLFR